MNRFFFVTAALVATLSTLWSAYAIWIQPTPSYNVSFNHALEATHADQLGLAIAELERVVYYQPGDAEARTLLRTVRHELQQRLSKEHREVSENHGTALENFSAIAAPTTWEGVLLVSLCAMLCAFAAGFGLRPSNLRTGLLSLGFLLMSAALASGLGWLGKRHVLSPGTPAIVHAPDAKLLQNPDPRASVSGRLLEGERVWLGERYPGFVRIERGDGTSGWVPDTDIQTISVID